MSQAFLRWDQGARALGVGGAVSGLSDDSSALFFNPAGIAFLPGTQLQVGAALNGGSGSFSTFGDGEFSRGIGFNFDGSFYITHEIAERVTGGLAVNSPWGFKTEWDAPTDFVGRFRSADSQLRSLNVNPVLALRASPTWSLAAGIAVLGAGLDLARYEQDPAVSALGGGGPIGLAKTQMSLEGVSIGWNAGVTFRPNDEIWLGAQYRSDLEMSLNGVAVIQVIAPEDLRGFISSGGDRTLGERFDETFVDQNARTFIVFPRNVAFGAAVRPIQPLRLMFDAQWIQWSANDTLAFAFSDSTLDSQTALLYEDTWTIRLGAEYWYRSDLAFRIGYAHEPSPAPTSGVTPMLPDADRNSLSFGAGLLRSPWVVDLAYRLGLASGRDGVAFPENDEAADGRYDATDHRLAVSLSYRF